MAMMNLGWNPKSRGEFLMIGYLYKVYRNITKVRYCVPNLKNPMCVPGVPKKCKYLSI